jgi:protein associated with RNAse G/E
LVFKLRFLDSKFVKVHSLEGKILWLTQDFWAVAKWPIDDFDPFFRHWIKNILIFSHRFHDIKNDPPVSFTSNFSLCSEHTVHWHNVVTSQRPERFSFFFLLFIKTLAGVEKSAVNLLNCHPQNILVNSRQYLITLYRIWTRTLCIKAKGIHPVRLILVHYDLNK